MNITKGVVSTLLMLSLLSAALAGCGGESGEGVGLEQDGDSEIEQSIEADSEQSGSQDGGEQAVFFHSEGIDNNGYWEGIKALDHVELFDYQAISVPSSTHVIPDERVQSEVNSILTEFSVDEEVFDRAVENGDTVNIDYVGSVDGAEFEGGTTGGAGTYVTIGVTSYIDDFLEQLIGHMPGETINVEVTFPENYGVEDLNGKDAVFVTTINHIAETTVPELTNDFVNEVFGESNGWTTVEDMNREISSVLQENAILGYVQEYLMEQIEIITLPDGLLTYVENMLVNDCRESAELYGMEIEEFLALSQGVSTVDELLTLYHDNNVEQANYGLAIQAIAEDAGIVAGNDDVTNYFANYVGTTDYSQYEEAYGMPYLKQVALNRLVLDHLIDNTVLG